MASSLRISLKVVVKFPFFPIAIVFGDVLVDLSPLSNKTLKSSPLSSPVMLDITRVWTSMKKVTRVRTFPILLKTFEKGMISRENVMLFNRKKG